MTQKPTKKKPYRARLKLFGKYFSAEGVSPREAIAALTVPNARGYSILSVEKGGTKRERVLQPLITSRLFSGRGVTREVALKNASLLFDL